MKPPYQIEGQRFGRLTVKKRVLPNRNGYTRWMCVCDCGKSVVLLGTSLVRGNTKSCGCWYRDTRRTCAATHGHAGKGKYRTGTYVSWAQMLARCTNPKHKDYAHYAGRGITVCERWRKFENFLADMGEQPKGLTLDRYPNMDGNYEPGNCRWATRKQQSENSSTPVLLTHNGITQNIKQWAKTFNVSSSMLYQRRFRNQDVFRGLS